MPEALRHEIAASSPSARLLSPEARLLLLTAGGNRNDAAIRALLETNIDWSRLAILAEWERAASVVCDRLAGLRRFGGLPPEAAPLRKLAMVAEFKSRYLAQRLDETLTVLKGRMEIVLLKGAALATSLYDDFTERPMLDLDLLVEEGRAEEAQTLLLRAGWVRRYDTRLAQFYREHQHLPPLDDARGTGVRLEVHTGLFPRGNPFHPLTDAVRAAATPVPGRSRVRVPHVSHLLLHACLHFAWSHMMSRGAWRTFRDVQTITTRAAPDWPRVVDMAKGCGGASCCYWTLRLAQVMGGVDVPGDVLRALRPALPEVVRQRVERHFILHLIPAESYCPSQTVARALWRVGIRPKRSGQGPARPWHRDDEFIVRDAEPPPTARSRVAYHLSHLRAWLRYIRSVAAQSPAR